MILSSYETHRFPDPLLPFIYHPHYHLAAAEAETNWHKNIEILCCFQGSGYVRCGTEVYDFTAGDVVVVNADLLHTVGSSAELSYCCLIVGSAFCSENGLPMEDFAFQNVIRDPELVGLMKDVADAHRRQGCGDLCAVADYRYAVLGVLRKLCRDHSTRKAGSAFDASGEHTKKAISYIRTHIAEKLSLDDIAAHVGISKFHLSREFKTLTGNTIVSFINILRCWEAKRLIEKGMRVSAAAYTCGFDNLSYFSRTFQKIIGALPSTFINNQSC